VAAESLSTIFSANSSAAFDGLVVFLSEGLLLYVLFSNSVDGERSLRAVAWTLLLAGGLLGALSLHQQLTGNFDSNYFGFAQVSNATLGTIDAGQPRLAGPVGEKNHYAQFMLMVIPLGVMLVLHERRRWARLALIVLIGFVTAGMVLTFSRGAAVGLVAIIIVMAALRYVSVRQLVAFGVVIALVLLAVPAYAQRLASLDVADVSADRVIASRATENAAAALVFVDHPLVGVGPDQFPSYYQSYAKEVGLVIHAGERESHNLYLGLAAEIGMLGLLAFLGMVGVTLRDLLRATRRWKFTRPERAALAAGFLLSLVGFLVSSVFLQLSYARYFWMILALAGAAGYILIRLPDTDAPHGDPPAQLP
jgi:O-antigen ligase